MPTFHFSNPLVLALVMAGAVLPAAAGGPVSTVVASDDPNNWFGYSVPELEGESRVFLSGGATCSGSLLAGGEYVLTAAHCLTAPDSGAVAVSGATLFFKQGQAGALTVQASAFYVAPGWRGFNNSAGDGSDLALIKLVAPVTTIAGYALSSTSELGKTFMMAGYGLSGTGATGAVDSGARDLHYGFNVIDTTDYALQSALYNGGYQAQIGPLYTKLGETYVYDFDNGQANQNAIQRLYGLVGISAGSNLGLSVSESMIGPGDSGGGDFVLDASGQYRILAGVHSYGWNLCTSVANGGIDDALANCVVAPGAISSFGSLGGSTAVYSHLNWIQSITAVPEPQTWLSMLAGLAVIGGALRRRANTAR